MSNTALVRHADFRQMQIQHAQNNTTSIYFFWNEETGLYKIGKSNDPERRRQELSSIMGMPLFCEFSFRAPIGAEKVIHKFMAPYHHSHEWFKGDEVHELIDCFEDFDMGAPDDYVLSAEDVEEVLLDWLNSYGRGRSASVDNCCGDRG